MNVPMLDLKSQYASIKDEVRQAVDEVLESQHFSECLYDGAVHRPGSLGDIGRFSFFPSKNLGGIGDGVWSSQTISPSMKK